MCDKKHAENGRKASTEGVKLSGYRDRMWIALWRHPGNPGAEGARVAKTPNLSGKRTEHYSQFHGRGVPVPGTGHWLAF